MFTYHNEVHTLQCNDIEVQSNIAINQSGYKNGELCIFLSCFSKKPGNAFQSCDGTDLLKRFNVMPYSRMSDQMIESQKKWLEENRQTILEAVQKHYA
ncbi:hypothetical protein MUB04_15690 [Acinetobacter indicus]|uniref:hypothetical protein n=1 Tax=Acinetobacter TaxID=469 RepID=UPI0015D185F4|nr:MULTISPECIES: hypothetical protein [Acinetobacter]MCP0917980.1 hypothetical protein [Acinetobacter indicus]